VSVARFIADQRTSYRVPHTVDRHGRPGPKLYLATVIDLYSRRLLGAANGLHPDAEVACAAIKMAVAARGGVDAVNGRDWRTDDEKRVIFHTDRGSTGGFQRSSQHLDRGGVWWRVRGSRGRIDRWVRGGSGGRIGHCGPRCARRDAPSRRGPCRERSGV
jgi:transposase InsO family protein